MKFQKRIANTILLFQSSKVRWAYGLASIVPNTVRSSISNTPTLQLHYTLIDSDECDFNEMYAYLLATQEKPFVTYPTRRGCHAVIFDPLPFQQTAERMLNVPKIDRTFVSIGIKRGYWFLESDFFAYNKPTVDGKQIPIKFGKIERVV